MPSPVKWGRSEKEIGSADAVNADPLQQDGETEIGFEIDDCSGAGSHEVWLDVRLEAGEAELIEVDDIPLVHEIGNRVVAAILSEDKGIPVPATGQQIVAAAAIERVVTGAVIPAQIRMAAPARSRYRSRAS